jgi:hypothetical protein
MLQTTKCVHFLLCKPCKNQIFLSLSPFSQSPGNNFDWNAVRKLKFEPLIHLQENILNETLYERVIKKINL